jgi:hypothetical protein
MNETQHESATVAHRSRWQRISPSMGWKAFWSEILIVVLGVAIALAASEAVQAWNWRNKVADAEIRLKDDVDRVFLWAAEQYVAEPCVDAQLDRLARNLMDSDSTLAPAPLHEDAANTTRPRFVMRQPFRPWQFSVWDALEADGTAAHFTQQRQQLYSYLNETVALILSQRNDVGRMGGGLTGLSYSLPLDAMVRREFLVTIESLRWHTTSQTVSSWQLLAFIDRTGLAPPEAEVASYVDASGTVQFCKAEGLPLADWRTALESFSSASSATSPHAPR